ncbi:tyrosine-type recombinase/integrase [Glutamicibacter sp.]|uniref:tyrosine-type recombinase/integrase n=1 Tax=Glutamicibacter sp. TaxID=1931995 RepID=UPI0039C8BAF4
MVLWQLGTRRGEVAGLKVDDINWRRGEITVRGKGNRHEVLPISTDVGEAPLLCLHESHRRIPTS